MSSIAIWNSFKNFRSKLSRVSAIRRFCSEDCGEEKVSFLKNVSEVGSQQYSNAML